MISTRFAAVVLLLVFPSLPSANGRLFGKKADKATSPDNLPDEDRNALEIPVDSTANDADANNSMEEDTILVTNKVRITLTNVDMNMLSSAEAIFVEDSFMSACSTNSEDGAPSQSGAHARSMIVVDHDISPQDENQNDHDRHLFGSFGYFDIWAYFEWSCYLCLDDDDDYHSSNGNRFLSSSTNDLRHFEDMLCENLRNGPSEALQNVEDCFITVVA